MEDTKVKARDAGKADDAAAVERVKPKKAPAAEQNNLSREAPASVSRAELAAKAQRVANAANAKRKAAEAAKAKREAADRAAKAAQAKSAKAAKAQAAQAAKAQAAKAAKMRAAKAAKAQAAKAAKAEAAKAAEIIAARVKTAEAQTAASVNFGMGAFDAFFTATGVAAEAIETLGEDAIAYNRDLWDDAIANTNALMGCKNFEDLARLQARIAGAQLAKFARSSEKFRVLSLKRTDWAFAPSDQGEKPATI